MKRGKNQAPRQGDRVLTSEGITGTLALIKGGEALVRHDHKIHPWDVVALSNLVRL
jgi:hypothetical protein